MIRASKYPHVGKRWKLLDIIGGYTVFGVMFPTDEQPDTTDVTKLESEESAEQRRNQQGQEVKVLTPKQLINRLPIL